MSFSEWIISRKADKSWYNYFIYTVIRVDFAQYETVQLIFVVSGKDGIN